MNIISKVDKYIQDNNLLDRKETVIVGVSGGADSIALLTILHELKYNCIAAHCNFHLRGEESNKDYLFVKDFCQKKDIRFASVDFDTYAYMEQNSLSLEMAARELRYHWFEQIRNDFQADKIAVAHHLDDSAETILINLVRGTGIRGLTGIPPKNEAIIRPLLCLYRDEIIEYLTSNNISFVTDSTNNEDIYVRNKIRLNIIPLLKSINPSAVQAIIKTSENLAATERIYNNAIGSIENKLLKDDQINIDLLTQVEDPKTVLFELLHPYGFNIDTVSNIIHSLDGISGKIFYSKSYRIIKDRKTLIIEKRINAKEDSTYLIDENTTFVDTPISLSLEVTPTNSFIEIEKNPHIIYIDRDKISFPLIIRKWKQGDRFIPFGMKGSKKISDYFSDQKLSLSDKENTWLLCSGEKIVWIIGKRADNRFRITDRTKYILKIILPNA